MCVCVWCSRILIRLYIYTCETVYIYIYIYIYRHIIDALQTCRKHMHMYVCMNVCVYTQTHTHTHDRCWYTPAESGCLFACTPRHLLCFHAMHGLLRLQPAYYACMCYYLRIMRVYVNIWVLCVYMLIYEYYACIC